MSDGRRAPGRAGGDGAGDGGDGVAGSGGAAPPAMNYHFHDDASSDGSAPLARHCRAAARQGLRHLCVTNHVEVMDEEGRWTVELEEAVPRFRAEMEAADGARERWPELDIRVGAEFEYRPEWTDRLEALAGEVAFDLVLGSVHVVDGLNVSGGPEPTVYFEGRSRPDAYRRYFETVEEMVAWGGFDVVGHFDLVARYGHRHHGRYDPREFEDVIRPTLEAMAEAGLGIEVNASGTVQAPGEPYPREEILAWAREAGVPFLTLGTDGHAPDQLVQGLDRAARIARRAGWRRATRFHRRRAVGTLALTPEPEAT